MVGRTFRGPSSWGGDGGSGGGGAPTDAPYVTTAANGSLSNETLIGAIILPPDTLANRPAAGSTVAGSLYFPTDETTVYRSTGAAWELLGTYTAPGDVFKQAQAVNAQTGTTYTLVAGDAGKLVTLSNASAITLTVPQDSDATIAVGTYVDLYALGAGQITTVAGSGATLRVSGLTAKSRAQYARMGVQKVSANTWNLFGDLAAS